ncbi:MAG: protein-glutamine glutaminase family protein, partial [Pseudomonadota bacterium]
GSGRWIFHIAPYVLVRNENGTLSPTVLDKTFADGPMKLHDWAKMFVELPRPQGDDAKTRCPEINNFFDYLKNAGPHSPEYCYLRTQLPIYLYAINELIDLDQYGIVNRQWDKKELVWAATGLDKP